VLTIFCGGNDDKAAFFKSLKDPATGMEGTEQSSFEVGRPFAPNVIWDRGG